MIEENFPFCLLSVSFEYYLLQQNFLLGLCVGNLVDPGKVFVPTVCASLEVLSDLGIRREKLEDNMVFEETERKELEWKSTPSELRRPGGFRKRST